MPVVLMLSKVIGTVSLGLYTGLTAGYTFGVLPAVIGAPEAEEADLSLRNAYLAATQTFTSLTKKLLRVSSVALSVAYATAPRRLRHPYLLYAIVFANLGNLLTSSAVWPYFAEAGEDVMDAIDSAEKTAAAAAAAARARAANIAASNEKAAAKAEPSPLDNSVYAHLDSDDSAESVASNIIQVAPAVSATKESATANYQKYLVQTSLGMVAFIISTIGIFGDLVK